MHRVVSNASRHATACALRNDQRPFFIRWRNQTSANLIRLIAAAVCRCCVCVWSSCPTVLELELELELKLELKLELLELVQLALLLLPWCSRCVRA